MTTKIIFFLNKTPQKESNIMKLNPLHDNVIFFEKEEADSKTDFGLILTKSDNSKICVVHAVGSKCLDVKVGDEILVDWKHANPVVVEDQQMACIKEENILAVL